MGQFRAIVDNWANNVVYVPTLAVFLVENALFLVEPSQAASNRAVVLAGSVALLWTTVGLSLVKLRASRWLANVGGLCVLMALVCLVLTGVWGSSGRRYSWLSIAGGRTFEWCVVSSFGILCVSMIGIELGSVFGDEVRDSRETIRWSVWRVESLALVSYLAGLAALFAALPGEQISGVSGILEAVVAIDRRRQLGWLLKPMGVLVCVSVLGAMFTWFSGAARIASAAIRDTRSGLAKARRSELLTPFGLIVAQGGISTAVLLMGFAASQVGEAYLILLDLTVILQLIPYLAIFLSLWVASRAGTDPPRRRLALAGLAGSAASLAGIIFCFVPAREVDSLWWYDLKLLVGLLGWITLGYLVSWWSSIGARESPLLRRLGQMLRSLPADRRPFPQAPTPVDAPARI